MLKQVQYDVSITTYPSFQEVGNVEKGISCNRLSLGYSEDVYHCFYMYGMMI